MCWVCCGEISPEGYLSLKNRIDLAIAEIELSTWCTVGITSPRGIFENLREKYREEFDPDSFKILDERMNEILKSAYKYRLRDLFRV